MEVTSLRLLTLDELLGLYSSGVQAQMPPKASNSASSSSSLSSIVASLTRAQFGVDNKVNDDDLDKHVAELLLKEARDKDKQWNERGTRAYYDPEKEK